MKSIVDSMGIPTSRSNPTSLTAAMTGSLRERSHDTSPRPKNETSPFH